MLQDLRERCENLLSSFTKDVDQCLVDSVSEAGIFLAIKERLPVSVDHVLDLPYALTLYKLPSAPTEHPCEPQIINS